MIAEEIRKLHEAMNLGYPLPNLDGPLFPAKMVVHDSSGRVTGAAALKMFAEAFLWLNVDSSTREKIEAIRELSEVMIRTAKALGLDEVSCWVPPQIEPEFAHMLTDLGWVKSPWPTWTKLL